MGSPFPLCVLILLIVQNRHPTNLKQNGRNNGGPLHLPVADEVAFGYPRDFLQNQFVYLVISPRAKGLSIGINLNPVVTCSFNCLYCEINRGEPSRAAAFDVNRMAEELSQTLKMADAGWLRLMPRYANVPADMLQVRHVTLSGDGEPTLSNQFVQAVEAVAHIRAIGRFFKIVLVTNSTALDSPQVSNGLRFFTREDEVWAKLDGGTDEYIRELNGSSVSLDKILRNILLIGRRRPVVIQSLFPAMNGEPPPDSEIDAYAQRLKVLKEQGAEISLVQIYSATRPMAHAGCGHLPLKVLSRIAQTVRRTTGLRAEVF
jgi:wyosine [tRNA(Phe)-imidazoG37] synthetase (radical SAM superfamily)